MKIYTKTGDDGTTALFDGTRVRKDHERVQVYGDIDELNSFVGLAVSFIKDKALREQLLAIQKDLFALGAKLANPTEKKQKDKADFTESKITFLENAIDEMEKSLTSMKSFILPGGHPTSSTLHICRTVCRRVERALVHISDQENFNPVYEKYLNRLSDYFFVAARYANHLVGEEDVPW